MDYAEEHTNQKHSNHVCATTTASSINSLNGQPSANEISLAVAVGKLYQKIKQGIIDDSYDDGSPIIPADLITAICMFDISLISFFVISELGLLFKLEMDPSV